MSRNLLVLSFRSILAAVVAKQVLEEVFGLGA